MRRKGSAVPQLAVRPKRVFKEAASLWPPEAMRLLDYFKCYLLQARALNKSNFFHNAEDPFPRRARPYPMHEEHTWLPPATITVTLQPEETVLTLPRPKTVLQLLHKLNIRMGTALVIRDGGLLTQDRAILPGDSLIVRTVTSSG